MGRGKVEIGGPLDNVGNPEEPRSRFIVGGDRSTTLPMQFKPTQIVCRPRKTRVISCFCRVLEDGGPRDDSCRYSEEQERAVC